MNSSNNSEQLSELCLDELFDEALIRIARTNGIEFVTTENLIDLKYYITHELRERKRNSS